MISTRQLIFILSLVFFFVNGATSGNAGSSSAPNEQLSNEEGKDDFEDLKEGIKKLNINIDGVNSEHLKYCKAELTKAFPRETTFDNFLHAFLYINTEDFLVTKTYSEAAYEYFNDLLRTAQDLNQPMLENPQQYCQHYHSRKVEKCLHGIEKIGCEPEDSGVICVQKLYLDWKKDESIVYSRPIFGTEKISDEELETALSRGAHRFPGLSYEEVSSHLTDKNLLEELCAEDENRRSEINYLQYNHDETLSLYNKARKDQAEPNAMLQQKRKSKFGPRGFSTLVITNKKCRKRCFVNDVNLGLAEQNYVNAHRHYIDFRQTCTRIARYNCYGVKDAPYQLLSNEYNRRQNTNTPMHLADSYATHLYGQITLIGRNMQLDSRERKTFTDPESFCVTYLSNNPKYYKWLYTK